MPPVTDITEALAWVGAGFAASATVLGILMKMLLSSYKKGHEARFATLERDLAALASTRRECEARERTAVEGLVAGLEKHRDRWDQFLKEYHVLDSTRGQKVDALFRIVDQMRETMKDIRPMLNAKVDDTYLRLLNELKLYARDLVRKGE